MVRSTDFDETPSLDTSRPLFTPETPASPSRSPIKLSHPSRKRIRTLNVKHDYGLCFGALVSCWPKPYRNMLFGEYLVESKTEGVGTVLLNGISALFGGLQNHKQDTNLTQNRTSGENPALFLECVREACTAFCAAWRVVCERGASEEDDSVEFLINDNARLFCKILNRRWDIFPRIANGMVGSGDGHVLIMQHCLPHLLEAVTVMARFWLPRRAASRLTKVLVALLSANTKVLKDLLGVGVSVDAVLNVLERNRQPKSRAPDQGVAAMSSHGGHKVVSGMAGGEDAWSPLRKSLKEALCASAARTPLFVPLPTRLCRDIEAALRVVLLSDICIKVGRDFSTRIEETPQIELWGNAAPSQPTERPCNTAFAREMKDSPEERSLLNWIITRIDTLAAHRDVLAPSFVDALTCDATPEGGRAVVVNELNRERRVAAILLGQIPVAVEKLQGEGSEKGNLVGNAINVSNLGNGVHTDAATVPRFVRSAILALSAPVNPTALSDTFSPALANARPALETSNWSTPTVLTELYAFLDDFSFAVVADFYSRGTTALAVLSPTDHTVSETSNLLHAANVRFLIAYYGKGIRSPAAPHKNSDTIFRPFTERRLGWNALPDSPSGVRANASLGNSEEPRVSMLDLFSVLLERKSELENIVARSIPQTDTQGTDLVSDAVGYVSGDIIRALGAEFEPEEVKQKLVEKVLRTALEGEKTY